MCQLDLEAGRFLDILLAVLDADVIEVGVGLRPENSAARRTRAAEDARHLANSVLAVRGFSIMVTCGHQYILVVGRIPSPTLCKELSQTSRMRLLLSGAQRSPHTTTMGAPSLCPSI